MHLKNNNTKNNYYGTFLGGYTGSSVHNNTSGKKNNTGGGGSSTSGKISSNNSKNNNNSSNKNKNTGGGGSSTGGKASSNNSKSNNNSSNKNKNTGGGGSSTSGKITNNSSSNSSKNNTGRGGSSTSGQISNNNRGSSSRSSSNSSSRSTSGITPTTIKNADNRVTGYSKASSGYKSSNNTYTPSKGATPTSIKSADNIKTGYKQADSGYRYLRTAKAEILDKNGYYIDGSIGNNFKRNLAYDEFDLYKDINSRGKNIKANDLYSFVNSISKHTPVYYEKGEKLYVVDSKTAGTLSVGPGIVLKYNNDYFKKYGLDVSNLREGAAIPASIVDKVTNDILADKRKYVLNVLETNNIKGLSDSQIDALTSRAYSVGNISNFPNMYKQYGNTEELYKNYLSTVNGKDTIYEKELTERRNAEINLFKNGYSSVEKENLRPGLTPTAINKLEKIKRSKKTPTAINSQDRLKDGYVNNDGISSNLRPGLTPTAINKIEKIKRSKKTPTAINSQDRLKDGYVNNDGISSNLRPGLTPSEINRQDKIKNQENVIKKGGVKDPLADYLEELKAKGIDTSDITDSSKSPQERSHAVPSSYYSDGHSLIEFNEGHTPLSADGMYYMVAEDPGEGHPLAVGKGVLLMANKDLFAEEGINVDDYAAVGRYLEVEKVDRVGKRIEENKRNEILKMAQDNDIVLTDYQVDALISRSYQFGNVNDFPAAYKAANGDIDTFVNNYMLSGGGESNRRQREADVFKNGYV